MPLLGGLAVALGLLGRHRDRAATRTDPNSAWRAGSRPAARRRLDDARRSARSTIASASRRGRSSPCRSLAAAFAISHGFRDRPPDDPLTGEVVTFAPWLTWLATTLWIVVVTNAINLIDGLDGLVHGRQRHHRARADGGRLSGRAHGGGGRRPRARRRAARLPAVQLPARAHLPRRHRRAVHRLQPLAARARGLPARDRAHVRGAAARARGAAARHGALDPASAAFRQGRDAGRPPPHAPPLAARLPTEITARRCSRSTA